MLERTIDLLIYLSVVLGLVLLPQLYGLVPSWLFYSVLGGWLAYVVVAILVATGRTIAYPLALALSIVTLAVSLPQPEHFAYVQVGPSLASFTFLAGSIVQAALVFLLSVYFFSKRKRPVSS